MRRPCGRHRRTCGSLAGTAFLLLAIALMAAALVWRP